MPRRKQVAPGGYMARFEKGQLDQLRALSRETGAPIAYFIRLAVKQFLESRVANVEGPK